MDTLKISFDDIYKNFKEGGADESISIDDIVVWDYKSQTGQNIINPETMPPIRIDAATIFLCTDGDITFNVDFKPYRLKKGSLLSLWSNHIVDTAFVSNNFQGYVIFLSNKLMMNVVELIPKLKNTIPDGVAHTEPLVEFDEVELQRFVDIIERIRTNMKMTDHIFQSEIVKNEIINFTLELTDFFYKKVLKEKDTISKISRAQETLNKFIELIHTYRKEQHEVAFYANKLHTTPGNLSRTITAASGKSPLIWINDVLIAESKILLHKPDFNVQQVADELHFSDQSSFGRFFKKHTGFTPMEYRSNIQGNSK